MQPRAQLQLNPQVSMFLRENVDVPFPSVVSVQWYLQGRQWLSHRLNLLVSRPLPPVLRVCARLDRHGIRPSYLGLRGSAPSGSGGSSSAVGLTSLPIINSDAESAAMLDISEKLTIEQSGENF